MQAIKQQPSQCNAGRNSTRQQLHVNGEVRNYINWDDTDTLPSITCLWGAEGSSTTPSPSIAQLGMLWPAKTLNSTDRVSCLSAPRCERSITQRRPQCRIIANQQFASTNLKFSVNIRTTQINHSFFPPSYLFLISSNLKIPVFRDVSLCPWVIGSRRFQRTNYLLSQRSSGLTKQRYITNTGSVIHCGNLKTCILFNLFKPSACVMHQQV